MPDGDRLDVPVGDGWIDLFQRKDGKWLVRHRPKMVSPDPYTGHTFGPDDPDLPEDYPGGDDPQALLVWARDRWGST